MSVSFIRATGRKYCMRNQYLPHHMSINQPRRAPGDQQAVSFLYFSSLVVCRALTHCHPLSISLCVALSALADAFLEKTSPRPAAALTMRLKDSVAAQDNESRALRANRAPQFPKGGAAVAADARTGMPPGSGWMSEALCEEGQGADGEEHGNPVPSAPPEQTMAMRHGALPQPGDIGECHQYRLCYFVDTEANETSL